MNTHIFQQLNWTVKLHPDDIQLLFTWDFILGCSPGILPLLVAICHRHGVENCGAFYWNTWRHGVFLKLKFVSSVYYHHHCYNYLLPRPTTFGKSVLSVCVSACVFVCVSACMCVCVRACVCLLVNKITKTILHKSGTSFVCPSDVSR